jgi:hypothetical protein
LIRIRHQRATKEGERDNGCATTLRFWWEVKLKQGIWRKGIRRERNLDTALFLNRISPSDGRDFLQRTYIRSLGMTMFMVHASIGHNPTMKTIHMILLSKIYENRWGLSTV